MVPSGRSALLCLLALLGCSSKSTPSHECGPASDEAPNDLACAGLYSDFDGRVVVKSARPFAPAVGLFSEGLEKSRWIDLPDGQSIDATVPDEWTFPTGTKVWKEFASKGKKIETRLLWKVRADKWVLASYVWSDDGTKATRNEGAEVNVDGLPYHVPTQVECIGCHKGRRDVILGFEAISLGQPAASGFTLATLAQEKRIAPAPAKTSVTLDPGVAYLHVNCGVSCHDAKAASERKDSRLRLRISFDEATNKPTNQWELFATTVNVPASLPVWNKAPIIAPGAPDKSAMIQAMTATASTDKMPPTRRDVDVDGVGVVSTFIRSVK